MKTLHVINLHMYASLSMGPWLKNHYSICMHIGITLPQLLTLCHNGITETNTCSKQISGNFLLCLGRELDF